jgi:hypothetical protein
MEQRQASRNEVRGVALMVWWWFIGGVVVSVYA